MPEVGFDADDAHHRIVLLQTPGDSHQRAGGAHGGDQHVDRAAGLAPDLLGGSVIVGLPVRRVVELVHGEIASRVFTHQAVDFFDGAVGPEVARREQDLRAARLEDPLAFDTDRFGHGQQQAVALDGADHGQADPRVAARGLDDDLLRGQLAGTLGSLDHVQRRAVLDGPAGVHVLQLRQQLHPRVRVHPPDLHQGRVADGVQHGGVDQVHCVGV